MKKNIFFIFLSLIGFFFCKEWIQNNRLGITGLSWSQNKKIYTQKKENKKNIEVNQNILWSITVGILYDSEYVERDVSYLKLIFKASANQISNLLTGIQIRYIIDQPQNAAFLMGRMPSFPSKKKGEKKNYHRKPTESSIAWKDYLASQTRYDLVLTNAPIHWDKKKRDALFLFDKKKVRLGIIEMKGRSGMEGYGAYVSYYQDSFSYNSHKEKSEENNSLSGQLSPKELSLAISTAILALVFPLPPSFIAIPKHEKLLLQKKILLPKLVQNWQNRLDYLQTIANINGKKEKGSCKYLITKYKKQGKYSFLPPKNLISPSLPILYENTIKKQYAKFLTYCRKKDDK